MEHTNFLEFPPKRVLIRWLEIKLGIKDPAVLKYLSEKLQVQLIQPSQRKSS